jgi:hypothetical protein
MDVKREDLGGERVREVDERRGDSLQKPFFLFLGELRQ